MRPLPSVFEPHEPLRNPKTGIPLTRAGDKVDSFHADYGRYIEGLLSRNLAAIAEQRRNPQPWQNLSPNGRPWRGKHNERK